jgi:hypothetical protein
MIRNNKKIRGKKIYKPLPSSKAWEHKDFVLEWSFFFFLKFENTRQCERENCKCDGIYKRIIKKNRVL